MITIIDYGAGNLFSVQNALNYLGLASRISRDPDDIRSAAGLILPGVGAFPDAMRMLDASGLTALICKEARKKPFLGICLGMQLLFETGYEFQETAGLGLLPGSVRKIETRCKIPHMGWNHLTFCRPCPLLEGISEGESVYFVHSFQARTRPECLYAVCEYGAEIPALVGEGTVFGAQFHPEKSGETGLAILRNFGRLTK